MTKKPTPKTEKGPVLEKTYETEIEYMCPVRGLVKQTVTVKKYQGQDEAARLIENVRHSSNLADLLDRKHSGLPLHEDTDDEDKSTL
jgi:hypothetical protein